MSVYQVVVDKNSDGQRADKFVKKILPLAPNSFIYKMFRKKDVKCNGKRIAEQTMIYAGDIIEMFLYEDKVKEFQNEVRIEQVPITFEIVYEDDNILIVNKPCGLLLHEDDKEKKNTLANQVLAYLYSKKEYDPSQSQGFVPGPVHRLDRNTSGLVIFGKNFTSLKNLNEMVRLRHCIEKQYVTVVKGYMQGDGHLVGYMKKDEEKQKCYMVSKETKGALTMETKYHVLKSNSLYSYVEITLVTGRTHQIRLHLSSISHSVIGDRKYGDFEVNRIMKEKYHLSHQLLHAYRITFKKCIGNLQYLQDKSFEASVSDKFSQIVQDLF